MKVIVFDLGGTLMQYVGMPDSWVNYYLSGFEAITQKYNCQVQKNDVEKSIRILTDFNPRLNYREIEYSAEYIFSKVLEHWHIDMPIKHLIETFWGGLRLRAEMYTDTINVLRNLKEKGCIIATLTDLPNGMSDEIFKKDISHLLSYFDYYVSSATAGYRKPNIMGLQMISDRFEVPVAELIFVGDEKKDRETANRASCKFIHIQRNAKTNGSISSLDELLEII